MKKRRQWTVLLLFIFCIFSMVFYIFFSGGRREGKKYHALLAEQIHADAEEIIRADEDGTRQKLTSDMQGLLIRFESGYAVKVSLVDHRGVPVLESNNVHQYLKCKDAAATGKNKERAYTRKTDDGYISTQYLDRLDLFLSVESTEEDSSLDPAFFVAELLLFFVITILMLLRLRKLSPVKESGGAMREQTDPRTGMYNDRYFNSLYGASGASKTTRYKSLAVFDIDTFAGEEERTVDPTDLQRILDYAKNLIGDRGVFFRLDEDEFVILMEWSVEFAYEICREFCRTVEDDGCMTVSVGLTQISIFDTVRKNYYRAVQYCYLVKEMGGNGVKRG